MQNEPAEQSVLGSVIQYRRRLLTTIVAAAVIIALALCVVFFWLGINSGARQALREARDIRIAFKMKAVEQYGIGDAVYRPSAKNGLVPGMEEQILELADADGEITLQSWDVSQNEASAFTFRKDRFFVVFKLQEDGTGKWDCYYSVRLISYE